jgi:hypothetical protein
MCALTSYCLRLQVLASSTIVPGSEVVDRLATLARRSFQIDLTCKNREGQVHTRKSVVGTAKVCTSFIYVPRAEINLGDCDVGSWRVYPSFHHTHARARTKT